MTTRKKKNGKKHPSVRRMKLLATLGPAKERIKNVLRDIEKLEKEFR